VLLRALDIQKFKKSCFRDIIGFRLWMNNGDSGFSLMKQIIHLDMDAFYASVEQRDRPELRGRPVIVGGSSRRGVVAACSYEARTFGVHSAMPIARAVRLCPEAVLLPVRMSRYREISGKIFHIFGRFTDRIEPLSIDEAFLDVSDCGRLFGPARVVAEAIRALVREETGLAISAGVAPNKFLAKLASESAKPDGLLEVPPEAIDSFLCPLPVSRLWGVGRVTQEKLERLGFRRVDDLRRIGRTELVRLLGSVGDHIFHLAWGRDDRPVETEAEIKSVGHEETFEQDLLDTERIRLEIFSLAERVAARLRKKEFIGRCLTLKIRYSDFVMVTRSETLDRGIDQGPSIFRVAVPLLERTEAGSRPVRLLGLTLSRLERKNTGQQGLFGREESGKLESLESAVDRICERFGTCGVRRGALLEREESIGKKGSDGQNRS